MSTVRKTITASVAIAALSLAAALPGAAQTAPDPHHPDQAPAAKAAPMPGGPRGMMDMMGMMKGGGMMQTMSDCPMMGGGASHSEGRIAFLKAELGITDAQKSVWEAYAAQVKANLQSMQGMQATMTKMASAKTPGERLDATIAAMEARSKTLKDMKPALTALYAALTAEQKAKADQLLTGMGCMM